MNVQIPKKSATRPTGAAKSFGPSFPSFTSVPKSERFDVFHIRGIRAISGQTRIRIVSGERNARGKISNPEMATRIYVDKMVV
jgi:hypothetical protein